MKTENKYLWIYLTGFFLILALPLLNLPPWFSPPDWGKTIVFRSILAVLLFVFIWQTLQEKKLSIKTSKSLYLLIALLVVFFLATLFSLDRTFSFWGNPYRSGGFLNFASYIIFAILAFLVLRKSDWQKVWIFSFIIAIFVSLIAIFQRFRILSKIFVSVSDQPWSTIGGSNFLAVYLLILSFLALSFIINSIKNLDRKWFFYLPALLLFLFVILLTISRAAYLGLLIGLIYFFLPYFKKIIKKPKVLIAISLLILIIIVSFFSFYSDKLPQRLSINRFLNDPRFSVWRISARAILENPILGYGPENFSIAFDKYYDSSLPKMALATEEPIPTTWYDRAHNFLFDIGVTAGIPALIIYLGLFASIFWGLQKKKVDVRRPEERRASITIHGVQAAFIAYLTANFFSFDIFSTYLVSFLLIGFSLSLISNAEVRCRQDAPLFKYSALTLLFIGLCWFIWAYNIKPFQINTEINKSLLETRKGQSERALRRMENIFPSDTFLNDYLRANYIEVINVYVLREPTKAIELIPRGIKIMKSTVEIRPNYTRYWIMLGNYHNILLENYQQAYPEFIEEWKNQADNAFKKALELSPKRQEILNNWSKTYFLIKDYQNAEEKTQKCIDLNPEYGACWWGLALINIKENNIEEAKKNIEIAQTKNYPIDNNEELLLDFKKAYMSLENREQYLKEICDINYKLVQATGKTDYKLNLLACYVKINESEKAKKLIEEIVKEWIEAGKHIRNFTKTKTDLLTLRGNILALKNHQDYYEEICIINNALITIDDSNPEYKIDLVECLLKTGDKKSAQELAAVIKALWPEYAEKVNKLIREAGL